MASEDDQEGGKWRREAGWQVAGGAAQGGPEAPLPVRRQPCSLPRGGCTNLPVEGLGLPARWRVPQPASPAGRCLGPGAGTPALSAAAWSVSSISVGLARGRAGHWDPPSHHWAPLLPHFAADSSPKQNRLSLFPPSGSLSLAYGCLLRRRRRRRPGRGALGQPCRDWDGAPGSWPSFSPVCGRRASFAVAVA